MAAKVALLDTLLRDGELITERLDHWATSTPNARCFHYGESDETFTFGEFSKITDSVSGFLFDKGVQKGEAVGVLSRNPLISAVAMLAIWKAGGIFAPVNFNYTGRLLLYQLNDTCARYLVVDVTCLQTVVEVWDQLLVKPELIIGGDVDTGALRLPPGVTFHQWSHALAGFERPNVELFGHDPANIVYTSGTTGPAKGVLLPHRWMAQYTFIGRLMLSSTDVLYNDLPLYHVGGAVFNVVRAMWVGAEVACWDRFSPGQFWSRIQKVNATSAILLDAMIPWLMNAPASDDDRKNSLCKAHMQPLPINHHAVASRFGIQIVTSGFGQTESGNPLVACIDETAPDAGTPSHLHRGLPREELKKRLIEFGVPVSGPQEASQKGYMGTPTPFFDAIILDDNDEECADNQVGQLCLRPKVTNSIFVEYLDNPTATAAALKNSWFHTGDAAMRMSNGTYAFVDRMGDRIRVRGENLSSYHVEDIFNQHADINFSAALAIPAAEGDEDDIVVFVVLNQDSDQTESTLQEWSINAMPKFMRPRHIRIVADLPRTATNKIEKFKLREMFRNERGLGSQGASTSSAPSEGKK